MLIIKAYAQPHNNGRGSQNRPGSGNNFVRPTSEQRRGNESMSDYYGRTGRSALGGNARTRGRLATIRRV